MSPLIRQWVLNPMPVALESSMSLSLSEEVGLLESGVRIVESGPDIHLSAWAGTPPALGW